MIPQNNNNNPANNNVELDPWNPSNNNNNDFENTTVLTNTAVWRERERRARSIRVFFMFLLMLLLMEEPDPGQTKLRQKKKRSTRPLEPNVFARRQIQDARLRSLANLHERYRELIAKNDNTDVTKEIEEWVLQQFEQEKDEFAEDPRTNANYNKKDPQAERKVWHYPWNATGFYRGEWNRQTLTRNGTVKKHTQKQGNNMTIVDAVSLETPMLRLLRQRKEYAGVYVIPNSQKNLMRDDHNFTSSEWDQKTLDSTGRIYNPVARNVSDEHTIPLSRDSGRLAFQFYARSVPSMKELSLVDGFIKLYDSATIGYSTRKDLLLRVRGVFLHSIGKLSLVSTVDVARSALVVDKPKQQRRLQEETLNNDITQNGLRKLSENSHPSLGSDASLRSPTSTVDNSTRQISRSENGGIPWSDVVFSYPYVCDDKNETIRRERTPAARRMPVREQTLEANAGLCEFEIDLKAEPIEWTVGAWRNLISRRWMERKQHDPNNALRTESSAIGNKDMYTSKSVSRAGRKKLSQDQALVLNLVGSIHSENCNFTASLNATALRTDWEKTANKAIAYTFYMMLVCLAQIMILLRQILHSQGNSAASRVSLMCIGWQTVIDALVCLQHIYFSLAIQPLFTAFASIGFLKLLIFSVIEMKYMSLIIQARNSSNGGQSTEVLRRQVAVLHIRFYLAVFITFVVLFNVNDIYRTICVLLLYSFWVPQIITNIITEARTPLHKSFIYGMTATRLVVPLYFFLIPNHFLKEVYPDTPRDPVMCELLVVWVAIQAAVLVAQSKYGARFMIPARFLPPKFDYSRPLPPSMIPTAAPIDFPASESIEDRGLPSTQSPFEADDDSPSATSRVRHTTAPTTRNRMRRTANRNEAVSMTSETVEQVSSSAQTTHHTLDCSICYDDIDVHDRSGYMLAPCNHIFHRHCLLQWMDVKMECPICRIELPPL